MVRREGRDLSARQFAVMMLISDLEDLEGCAPRARSVLVQQTRKGADLMGELRQSLRAAMKPK
jgi:hypothetical protein